MWAETHLKDQMCKISDPRQPGRVCAELSLRTENSRTVVSGRFLQMKLINNHISPEAAGLWFTPKYTIVSLYCNCGVNWCQSFPDCLMQRTLVPQWDFCHSWIQFNWFSDCADWFLFFFWFFSWYLSMKKTNKQNTWKVKMTFLFRFRLNDKLFCDSFWLKGKMKENHYLALAFYFHVMSWY